jgi:hypothetical protein
MAESHEQKHPHDVANTLAPKPPTPKPPPRYPAHAKLSARSARRLGSAEGAPRPIGTQTAEEVLAGWLSRRSRGIVARISKDTITINPHTTTTMKALSTALLRTFSPLWRSEAPLATVRGCLAQQQQQQRADFSSTPANQARDKRNKKDPRISMPARMELLQLQFRIRTAG